MTPWVWRVVLVGAALGSGKAAAGQDRGLAVQAPADWPMPARDFAATRYSPLARITPANVAGLKVHWSFATGSLRGHEGGPLVVNGRLYLHTPHPVTVYGFDLDRPGDPPLWKYAPGGRDPAPSVCCEGVSRGIAWHPSGRLLVPLTPGDLAAVDAATGREIWRVRNGNPAAGVTMPAAPLVVGDLVIVGVAGGEFGGRGHLSAYDVATGTLRWRAWSTGPDADVLLDPATNLAAPTSTGRDLGVSTWSADSWRRGGGSTWGWLSYDPELRLLYHGTGGAAPFNPLQRIGDNKWTGSLLARDPETGRVRWAVQLSPASGFAWDGSNESILADLTIRGQPVKALVHFDQNGFAYTIDRTNGRILLAEKYGPVNWARSVDITTGRPTPDSAFRVVPGAPLRGVCPSVMGMKGHQPAAHSPLSGQFYVPVNNLCMDYQADAAAFTEGRPFQGATIRITPGPGGNRGRFIAWDATTGAIAWEVREPFPVLSGALATAGGLVFYGTLDGWLKALDASNGREVWRFKTPSGIIGNPITFAGTDGRQYVAVVSGVGGWAGAAMGARPNARPTEGLGTVGLLRDLPAATNAGGVLLVFGL